MSPQQRELTVAYRRGLFTIRRGVIVAVSAAWDTLGSWNEADVARFLATVTPAVTGAQAQTATLTGTYVGMSAGGSPVNLDPDRYVGAAVRNGAGPDVVYRRPFQQLWRGVGAGTLWQQAQQEARARLLQTAATDLSLTSRAAARDAMGADPTIVGYQRVTAAGACKFCEEISTRRYNKSELMPVHPNCACTAEPITDPAMAGRQIIDQEKYDRLHAEGVETKIVQHGELGPVVYSADWNFNSLAA